MRRVAYLSQLAPGTRARIIDIQAGYGLRRRLISLGLAPGQEITVLQSVGRVLIVSTGSTTVALCRGMAQKILVEVL
ncbi:MAG: ferrous iron transport protein A [Crenarchaeota archaeon]|nr:ferrous iron transport protein A [Thermoproteota archaeon]